MIHADFFGLSLPCTHAFAQSPALADRGSARTKRSSADRALQVLQQTAVNYHQSFVVIGHCSLL